MKCGDWCCAFVLAAAAAGCGRIGYSANVQDGGARHDATWRDSEADASTDAEDAAIETSEGGSEDAAIETSEGGSEDAAIETSEGGGEDTGPADGPMIDALDGADACEPASCWSPWDGFQPEPPFSFQAPLDGIDYDGDGIPWSHSGDDWYAVIFPFGCEAGDVWDNAVQFIVETFPADSSGWRNRSELFVTDGGALLPEQRAYTVGFSVKVTEMLDPKLDWEIRLKDASNDRTAIVILLASTRSTTGATPGGISLAEPGAGPGAYLDADSALDLDACRSLQVTLDNGAGTVEFGIDGDTKVTTVPYQSNARRLDYFEIRPIRHDASGHVIMPLHLDVVSVCTEPWTLCP